MPVLRNHPLASLTTFGLPSSANFFCPCASVEQVKEALSLVRSEGLPLTVLGGGSNVLLTGDLDGLVLHNRLEGIEIVEENGKEVWVKVGAGVPWHALVVETLKRGWYGLENLSLIPGSVGASPMQNIGAYGIELEARFHALDAIEVHTGQPRSFSHSECEFGYRESIFKKKLKGAYVITHVTFRLSRRPELRLDYGAIREELDRAGVHDPGPQDVSNAVIRIRKSKLPDPSEVGNAGSFFKNPVLDAEQFSALQSAHPDVPHYPAPSGTKVAAGWLIDRAGWKGHHRGTHGIHDRQALVLVHHGGASGADLLALAQDVQQDVASKFGVALEREVNVLPLG
jgi:UDP-N-acetylmuramate dehydrogenase